MAGGGGGWRCGASPVLGWAVDGPGTAGARSFVGRDLELEVLLEARQGGIAGPARRRDLRRGAGGAPGRALARAGGHPDAQLPPCPAGSPRRGAGPGQPRAVRPAPAPPHGDHPSRPALGRPGQAGRRARRLPPQQLRDGVRRRRRALRRRGRGAVPEPAPDARRGTPGLPIPSAGRVPHPHRAHRRAGRGRSGRPLRLRPPGLAGGAGAAPGRPDPPRRRRAWPHPSPGSPNSSRTARSCSGGQ
jgi:hypothetical protein